MQSTSYEVQSIGSGGMTTRNFTGLCRQFLLIAPQAVNAIKIMKRLKRCNKFAMYDCIAIPDQSYCIGIAEENIAIYCNTNILLHP